MVTRGGLLNKNFVLLFQGQLVSQLGNAIFRIGVVLWLKQETESPTTIGFFFMATMLPILILGPFSGAIADRVSRKRIIVLCDLVFACLLLSVYTAVSFFSSPEPVIALLIVAALGAGAVEALFRPAVNASIPDLVPRAKIEKANGMLQSSLQVSFLVGQFFGSVLFGILGATTLILINGIGFLFSAFSESFMAIPQRERKKKRLLSKEFRAFKSEAMEGFRYVAERSGLRKVFMVTATLEFFIAPCAVLLPFLVEDTLKAGPEWYGFLLVGVALGVIVGNMIPGIVNVPPVHRGKAVAIGVICISLILIGISYLENVADVLAILLAFGVFVGLNDVLIVSAIQRGTAERFRGRVLGLYTTVRFGLTPISMGLAGVIAGLISNDITLFFFCCGVLGLLICPLFILSRDFHSLMASVTEEQQSPTIPKVVNDFID